MKTNAAGRKIIIGEEAVRLEAYPDPFSPLAVELRKPAAERRPNWLCLPGDPWTIGVGATGPGIGPGVVWTKEQVWARFERDLAEREAQVADAVETCLNENQFSALVSFVFNEGIGKLTHGGPNRGPSTLLAKLNDGDVPGAAAEFLRWDFAGGHEVARLRERRLAEQKLFLTVVAQAST